MAAALLIIFSVSLSFAKEPTCFHDKSNFRCVKFIRNYDGDTGTFEIPNIHPLIGKKISVRINGVDTPEVRTSNSCEKNVARIARKLVGSVLKNAKRIDLLNAKRGKYFRIVADIQVDGKLLKDILLENKLAYEYDGSKKIAQDWCRFGRVPAKE